MLWKKQIFALLMLLFLIWFISFVFLFTGKVSSIRHLKNEVDSIKNGVECGIALSDGSIEPQHGDTLVCYQLIQVAQKSEWDPGF